MVNEGDTHIHYYIDDVMVDRYYGYDPIPIDDLPLGEHTIKVELFNADHTGTGIFDQVTVNVTGAITCNETPFPDSWVVHEFDENPYTVVYTFADDDLDGDGLKDIVTGGWWYSNPGSAGGNWEKNTIGGTFKNVAHVYDFDGDGDMDLLGTTGEYTGAQLVWAQMMAKEISPFLTIFLRVIRTIMNPFSPVLLVEFLMWGGHTVWQLTGTVRNLRDHQCRC